MLKSVCAAQLALCRCLVHELPHDQFVNSPAGECPCLLLSVRDLNPPLGDAEALGVAWPCELGLWVAAGECGVLRLPPALLGEKVNMVHCRSCVMRLKPPNSCSVCRLLVLYLTADPICRGCKDPCHWPSLVNYALCSSTMVSCTMTSRLCSD